MVATRRLSARVSPRQSEETMPLKWLDAKTSVAFAAEISREIQVLVPVAGEDVEERRHARQVKSLERLLTRVRTFSKQHHLNIYQKAKFANTIRWSLREAGYPKDFIESVLAMMLPIM
jgi:hypothetical protein